MPAAEWNLPWTFDIYFDKEQIRSCYACWLSGPLEGFRVESWNEALCALGKTGKTSLRTHIFRSCFQWAQFFYCVVSKKSTKNPSRFFMVTTASRDWHKPAGEKSSMHVLLLHQNNIYTELPSHVFGAVSQLSKWCLLGYSPCAFFFF